MTAYEIQDGTLREVADPPERVDLVRVVRCRDCVHYVADPEPIDPGWPMMCDESGRDMLEPDGFCAWGERRADHD